VVFSHGKITITPISDRLQKRLDIAKNSKDLMNAFVACSGGVDALSLSKEGFKISTLLEFRPQEKRDKRDMTEVCALSAASNVSVDHLINQDIGEIDLEHLARMTKSSNHTLLHISLQCDDFSPVKAKTLKQKALEDLSTSSDQVYDMMRLVETIMPPTIILENVPNFMTSEANAILETKLKKWGYTVYKNIAYSPNHEGATGRKRYYMFATSFPVPFVWPTEKAISSTPIWDKYIAPYVCELREVSNSKSIQDGAKSGRLRIIEKNSIISPTVLRSQDRMAKDSVVIRLEDGRYLFPNNAMIKRLMGIPEDFNVSTVGKTIESEIVGQSIDWNMHTRIIRSIREHLEKATVLLFGSCQKTFAL